MGVSDTHQHDGRPRHVFGLIPSKLHRPVPRPGTVQRSSLIERLARGNRCPVVSVVAPAGYGKTTLVSQWAEHDGQASVWVSVDEGDNDPKVLLAYVAAALDAVEPIDQRVFDALASPASSVPGVVVPRLCAAFWSMTTPVVLVLDDVHLVHSREGQAALSMLAEHVPEDSQLVLAGRTRPPVRIARLRAEGRILEIGPDDMSLTAEEAASLLRAAKVALGEEDVAELHRRTEGWAVGLYLAALSLREGGSLPHAAASFGGADRFVSEYVESELLARISKQQREFLTRAAVLERMCGPLCEAALGLPGSAATLADLAGSNLLLVPLDRRGEWYRYHHLFRDMLQAELERREPGLPPIVRRRAAAWCLGNGLPEEALEYSIAAGDVDTAAGLVQQLGLRTLQQNRRLTIQRWLRWLDERGGMDRRPLLAAQAAFLSLLLGQPAEADRWADAVDRWHQDPGRTDDPYTEAWAAGLRATLCRHGVEQMRADADEAVRRCAAAGILTPTPVHLQGLARVLCGDLEGAGASFEEALGFPEETEPEITGNTLCEQSLLAMDRGEWGRAETLAGQARAVLRRKGVEGALSCAVQARLAMHRGDVPVARRELISAQPLRPLLTYTQPHFAVQVRIELTRVHLALADIAGAWTLMKEIDEILRRRPNLGVLVGEAAELRARLAQQREVSSPGASALTAAELRLLPLLSTHLSFPEVGEELFLSTHTIKSQARSIYRKLDATSRSQAVAQARKAGLLEG
jgi:LuxR family maltose regulon positive regulatory protein